MKRLLSLILVFSLGHSQFASAGAVNSSSQEAMNLVEDYLALTKPTGQLLNDMSQNEYLAQGVLAQILTLEPDDFNVFLFNLLQRYIAQPASRPALFALLNMVTASIGDDLAVSAKLREGPADSVARGAMIYGAIAIVAILVLRKPLGNPLNRVQLMSSMRDRGAAIAARSRVGKVAGFAGRSLFNSFTVSGAIGGGIGYVEYMIETSRAHRLDPSSMLKVVQAQLACKVSYDTMVLYDKVNAYAVASDPRLQSEAPQLRQELDRLATETEELGKEFPALLKADVNGRAIHENLNLLPAASDWQQYRSQLVEQPSPEDFANFRCPRVALKDIGDQLKELDFLPKNEAPAAGPAQP